VADGQTLTMDYTRRRSVGAWRNAASDRDHHSWGGTTVGREERQRGLCGGFSGAAGMRCFGELPFGSEVSVSYMVLDVQRALRFIRHNAKKWDADPDKIALVGVRRGIPEQHGGLLNAPGDLNATDPVDRESAKAQAVVSLMRRAVSNLCR